MAILQAKDLAVSISLEASELLDILICAAMLADDLGFDFNEIVMKKLKKRSTIPYGKKYLPQR